MLPDAGKKVVKRGSMLKCALSTSVQKFLQVRTAARPFNPSCPLYRTPICANYDSCPYRAGTSRENTAVAQPISSPFFARINDT
jgi:hypothetical protein